MCVNTPLDVNSSEILTAAVSAALDINNASTFVVSISAIGKSIVIASDQSEYIGFAG